jgi:outer membrane autotransporter protein
MKKSSKNKRLKNSLITRATLAALALITVANPETKAQVGFSVNAGPYSLTNSGTAGNDTITGSGTFTGWLDATQGGVDTITVLGNTTITNAGGAPYNAIINAGLGTITVNSGSVFSATIPGETGIYALSTVSSPGTQSTTITNAAQITSDLECIAANITNNVAGGSSAVTINNTADLLSFNNVGIAATTFAVVSSTTNIQNSGDISSLSESISASAIALLLTGGDTTVSIANTGNLNSLNSQGINAGASGITSAFASVQNSGNITAGAAGLEAVFVASDTSNPGATGDSLISFSNSGNLLSNNDDAVELDANSRNNATINFNNSGTAQTNTVGPARGIRAVANATTGTGGVATITGSNSGQVTAANLSAEAVLLLASGNVAANIGFSNSGGISASNGAGIGAVANATFAPNASASVNISNSGNIAADYGISVTTQATGNASTSVTNFGTITSVNDGISTLTNSIGGSGKTTVTNTGTINAGAWGIFLDGLNPPEAEVYNLYGNITSVIDAIRITNNVGVNRTWLVGGNISAGGMVFQGNGNSTLYVINNPQLNGGMMDGGNPGNTSQIKFKLVGMSPKEAKKAKAQMGNSAGSFTINGGKLQYNWQDFDGGSSGTFISLQLKVDKSLVPTAKWLDNNAYKFVDNPDIGKFYQAAGDKPGEMIANLMGQAEALARNDVLLEYSNLIAHAAFNLGHDFAAGYAARSFDISMVNLYRPDVLMAGNAIINRLDRISDSPMRSPRKAEVNNITPWSFWIGGNALVASHEKWEDRAGYDNLTGNPMLGLNYRPSANTNIGLMGGATITELEFTNGSKLEGNGALFALHGTQRFADFYTSAFIGGGLTGFEQQRRIMGRTARADFESSMVTTGGNVGYGFKLGNLTLAPEVGLVYSHLMHDKYQETGAGVFNRTVGSNEVDSLKTRLGGRLSYLVEMADWVFAPFIHASWAHELLYDNNEAPVKLPRFGMPSFDIGNDNPERDSALIGVGVSGKVNKLSQLSWYVGYEANLGFSNYISHTSSLGLRLDF